MEGTVVTDGAVPSALRFAVLGPLQVLRAGNDVTPSPPRQRALLAVLLIHAGEPVSLDRLIEEIWEEKPPPGAVNLIRGYVSKLRGCLGDRDGAVLRTVGTGYLLQLPPGDLDAQEFTRLLSESRQPSTSPEQRAQLLTHAEKLWQGRPYSGVPSLQSVQAESVRLEEDRLAALEEGIELRLGAGEHAMVVGTLGKLAATHPLRERLRHQLMIALSRCGRQADALEVYREFRQRMREELGAEPSRALRELQAAVLRQDPSLDPPGTSQPAPVVSPSSDLTRTPPAPPIRSTVHPSYNSVDQPALPIQDRSGDDIHDDAVDRRVIPGRKGPDSGVRRHRIGATVTLAVTAIALLTAVVFLLPKLFESAVPGMPIHLTRINATAPPPAGQAGVLPYRATRYGYTGMFRDGTHILDVDWNKLDNRFGSGKSESFGIAPSGTIWRAWPGSNGWKEVPKHGQADETYGYAWSYPNYTVAVWVRGSNSLWCNTNHDNNWWSNWYPCRDAG